jgi:hypothetical protein
VWEGLWEVDVAEPSPKFQEYAYGLVPPEAEPLKDTVNGAAPVVGVPDAEVDSGSVPASAADHVISVSVQHVFPGLNARLSVPEADVELKKVPIIFTCTLYE